jgi:hypothetical protein
MHFCTCSSLTNKVEFRGINWTGLSSLFSCTEWSILLPDCRVWQALGTSQGNKVEFRSRPISAFVNISALSQSECVTFGNHMGSLQSFAASCFLFLWHEIDICCSWKNSPQLPRGDFWLISWLRKYVSSNLALRKLKYYPSNL